jgi:sulfhydrogenase subunit beta (sulfur reductase)
VSKMLFFSEAGLSRLLEAIQASEVYAAVRREQGPEYSRLQKVSEAEVALRQPRPSASPKAFLQPARERVAVYSAAGFDADASRPVGGDRALVGLRACDLAAIAYLDKVFREGDFADPFYEARRRAEFLVGVDCTAVHENCFCAAVGGRPFAESGFDLNLTPLESGYLVEVGSEKGQEVVDRAGDAAREPTDDEMRQREAARQQAKSQVEEQSGGLRVTEQVQALLAAKQSTGELGEMASRCVECAACTFICPTCHCFYLYDQVGGEENFERIRTWDSCILGDYSRMAGPAGAKPTPRPSLRNRCANRLLHKYVFSPQQYGMLGCTGCGRCIEACCGKIDIREVLRELTGDTSG